MNETAESVVKKAARIRLLILDVDGVLTDGRLFFGDDGREFKAFHSRDGHGLKMLQAHGVDIAIISGRTSAAVTRRMAELSVRHVYQGIADKIIAYTKLLEELALRPEQTAYVGDDIVDLPVMARVGLAVAVADADAFVLRHAHWRTPHRGGLGAVRDVCELILLAQNHLASEQAACWPVSASDTPSDTQLR
ncbi:MAG: 3-deoxy-manno-octulosonate-8-phosphatase KdsC [Gammaproteobacteria bacterium]|nr:3-deoxy-manno-octulosonate-8-phosphatase KdsC [Gammaproteobacteria bacterium]